MADERSESGNEPPEPDKELFEPSEPEHEHAPDDSETYGLRPSEPLSDLFNPAESSHSSAEELEPAAESPETTSQSSPSGRKRKRRRESEAWTLHDSLISALWYPFTERGPVVLVIYSILVWIITTIPIPIVGGLLALVVGAYVGLMFLETASFTLERIPTGPRFPELGWESFSGGMFGLLAMLISQLPLMLGRALMGWAGVESAVVTLLLLSAGMYYLPMAFLVLADLQSERALNPLLVLRAIRRMGGWYFRLVTAAVAAFLVPSLVLMLFPLPALLRNLINTFLLLYIVVALMRAVGLACLHRGVALLPPARKKNEQAD